jgi:hypothetical protein
MISARSHVPVVHTRPDPPDLMPCLTHLKQPEPTPDRRSSARSNAAVLTQCHRLASGPVLALIPAEAGMPAHGDVLRGRIEGAAGV